MSPALGGVYLQGLDLIRYYEQSGRSYGNIYLLGHISPVQGFPGYFLVASALKLPIATQFIVILSMVLYFARREKRVNFIQNESFLLISVVFFTIYFNFFFNTQIGIRYYLPMFPLLYIFSGSLFVGWKGFTALQRSLAFGLMVYLFISVFSYYPYNISYFNEFVWDRTQAYKYLADSNIDWGQGKNDLWDYLLRNPAAIYRPNSPRSGLLVVSVNDLVGITIDPDQFAWLRGNFEPIDTIAYSYLVYDVSSVELDTMCATTIYCGK